LARVTKGISDGGEPFDVDKNLYSRKIPPPPPEIIIIFGIFTIASYRQSFT
jgi:hypothetical protein